MLDILHTPYVDPFELVRVEDESGVSGTGVVALGVRFPGGSCAVRWLTTVTSTTVYASIEDVVAIHGHGGKTRVRWMNDTIPPVKEFGDSPWARGMSDCELDLNENAPNGSLRGGDRPEWGADWSEVYAAEWLAGYRFASRT